jgi:DNA-binding HxlR family transcriptional regulator
MIVWRCFSMAGEMCPRYEQAALLLGKKWTGLLLRVLMEGPKRFSDFGVEVPQLSDRMLSERLKELEEAGIVERLVYPSKPVQIEYRLTDKGRELHPVVEAIQAWANRWIDLPGVPVASAPQHGED